MTKENKDELKEYELKKKRFKRNTKLVAKKLEQTPSLYSFVQKCYRKYYGFFGMFNVLPDFCIIGTSRSGTTSLYQGLVKHPNIHEAATKEIQFFGSEFFRGINWYRFHFPSKFKKFLSEMSNQKFITGEATPRSFDYPHMPKIVKNIIPDIKLIAILRNPIDRAFSHYSASIRNKRITLSFEDAIKTEDMRIKGELEKMENDMNYVSSKYSLYGFLTRGKYHIPLKRWMDVFPKEQIFIIRTEDFYENSNKVFNELYKFLDIPQFNFNDNIIYNKKEEKSSINSETRNELIEYFQPHNEKLSRLLNRDFHWNK